MKVCARLPADAGSLFTGYSNLFEFTASLCAVLTSLSAGFRSVLTVDGKIINEALSSGFKDFEDAIQYHAAHESKFIDILITRDIKEYKTVSLPVMTPDNFLKLNPQLFVEIP